MKLPSLCSSALVVAGLAVAVPALAGQVYQSPVVADPAGHATGSLVTARTSASTREFIGCYSWVSAGTGTAVCVATDVNARTVSCYTHDAALLGQIRSLDNESALSFDFDKTGQCTSVFVYTESAFKP